MIKPSDCVLAGKVNKAHGLDGELSISFFSDDIVESVEVGACLIFEVDGIHTPFFVRTVRPRGAEALLVAFDDVDTQEQAQAFVGKSVYAVQDGTMDNEADEADGMYAGQIVGYTAVDADTGAVLGRISDIDDATDNVLFIVSRPDGGECRIPAVEYFITSISRADHTISFSLPEGLLDL